MILSAEAEADRAAREVLDLMDRGHRAARPVRTAVGRAYEALFLARWDDALARSATLPSDAPHAGAVRAQIEALLAGGARIPDVADVDPGTVAGAMAVFHASEATHVAGDIGACRDMLERALAHPGVPDGPRVWLRLAHARSLIFTGDLAAARAAVEVAADSAVTEVARRSALVVRGAIDGLLGRRDAVAAAAEQLRRDLPDPATYADAGIGWMMSLGLATSGWSSAAVELLLHSSGGPGLPLMPPTLRAYAFDVLIEAALGADREDLARWVMAEFDRLDLADNEQMRAVRESSRARLDVVGGDRAAGDRARATAAAVTAQGHRLHAARAAVVAELATGDLAVDEQEARARRLDDLVAAASYADLRAWMDRTLAAAGLVPRPLTGVGWDQLTPTQEVVARLAATGLSNAEIAAVLVVSPRTVEDHVAAVLARLGVASRIGLITGGAAATSVRLSPAAGTLLTPRQREVAALLATGAANADIATALGITRKAVEAHLAGIYRRLEVGNRAAAVARLVGG